MAISGQQNINIGAPNDPVGSDSLYTAFTKTQNNFDQLFSLASPITTIAGGNGINVNSVTSSAYSITNTGVTRLIAGNNISITNLSGVSANTGDLIISATGTGGGGGGGGTVTSVGLVSSSLDIFGGPITVAGNIQINLPNQSITPGFYTNPSLTVDSKGRITSIANGTGGNGGGGNVSSVAITGGFGLEVTGSPITSSGVININNTGVTRITAGTGLFVNQANGNVTISSISSGTVTSIGVLSNSLTVTGGPITTSGSINIELPSVVPNATYAISAGSANTAGLANTANSSVFANTAGSANVANLATIAGFANSATFANTASFANTAGSANIATTANSAATVSSSVQPNITSVGTLTSLNVSGNVTFTGPRAALGNVSTVKITGGSLGQVLSTDGAGNLSWVAQSGVGSGVSGTSGFSGFSGFSGAVGASGFSGAAFVGSSGFSGYSGLNGTAAASGFSGTSGWSGLSGFSGTGGTPGGSNTQVQFNDGSSFGGNSSLTFNKTTSVLTVGGNIVSSGTISANSISSNTIVTSGTGVSTINSSGDILLNCFGGAGQVNSTGNIRASTGANGGGFVIGKIVSNSSAPVSASSTGVAGQIAYDTNYVYICVAANTWKRVSLATF
jgi:hypothetical protein